MKVAGVILSPIHQEDDFKEINPDLGNMDNFKAIVKSLNESSKLLDYFFKVTD
jgi:hypothetical protein